MESEDNSTLRLSAEDKRPVSAGASPEREKRGFLRRRTWLCRLAAVPFVGACGGVVVLLALYYWPSANVPVYYLTVRPAFVWFGMLAPCLLPGLFGVRFRWFVCGCGLWLIGLVATEEVVQCVKVFDRRARERFRAVEVGFLRSTDNGDAGVDPLEVPLRIISWNVRNGTMGRDGVAADLASLAPDIVLMQEFGPFMRQSLLDAFARSASLKDYHIDGSRRAILSRFPIERVNEVAPPGRLSAAWRVQVAPGVKVICVSVHLPKVAIRTELIRRWNWREIQKAIGRSKRALKDLRTLLDLCAQEGPVILAGDFNLPPHYPDLRAATTGLKDCFADNGYGWGKTAPARLPVVRFDMIFVPRQATVYYARAVPTRFSDHSMAFAEVTVPIARSDAQHTALDGSADKPTRNVEDRP